MGRFIAAIVLLVLILTYVLYNTGPVAVRFLFWELELSTALVTLGSFLAGIIVGAVIVKIDSLTKSRKKRADKNVAQPTKGGEGRWSMSR